MPVSKHSTLRALLAVAAKEDLEIDQLDIKTAFLNGVLEEEVWMEQPEGYERPGDLACYLQKTIYGLRQAPRAWHARLKEVLEAHGLTASDADAGSMTSATTREQLARSCTWRAVHVLTCVSPSEL